jgi:competence protein ComEC
MRWNDYPVVRLLIPFIAGILCRDICETVSDVLIWAFVVLAAGLFLFSYVRKFYLPYKLRMISGVTIYLLMFVTGGLVLNFQYPYNSKSYYGNFTGINGCYIAMVNDAPVETPKSVKVTATMRYIVTQSKEIPVSGDIVIYFEKSRAGEMLHYGDFVVWKKSPGRINPPRNPETFDYAAFMNRKGIRHSVYLRNNEWKKAGSDQSFSIKKIAFDIRNILLKYFRKNGIDGDEYAVASSLILGYRNDISDELKEAYRSAGVMHVLCVSGMHVGIIYMIINYLLTFLESRKNGRQIKLLIIIFSIWSFAVITGLSPSVTRAAVMFSFVSIGKNINRHINIYNTLASSALITLIFSPSSIFDVGFLFSYVAVISIATLYKPVYSLWIPRYKVIDAVWKIAAVSIAAQIGTSPFSMYFFHQFPNYFLVTNIVVIILITPVFYLTFAGLVFSFWPTAAQFFTAVASVLISFMNNFVTYVGELPFSVTSGISFGFLFLLLLVALIISVSIMLVNKKPEMIFAVFGIIILMLLNSIIIEYRQLNTREMVAFNVSGHTAVLFRNGHRSVLALDSAAFNNYDKIDFQTSGYIMKNKLNPEKIYLDDNSGFSGIVYSSGNIIAFGNKVIMFSPAGRQIRYRSDKRINLLMVRGKYLPQTAGKSLKTTFETILLSSQLGNYYLKKHTATLLRDSIPFYNLKRDFAFTEEF